MKFKLLAGQHVTEDKSQKPRVLEDPTTGEETKIYPNKTHNMGDIVESDDDLVLKHGTDKFQMVDNSPSRKKMHTQAKPGPSEPTAFPGGQVASGHQQTTGMPDGKAVSGPFIPDENHPLMANQPKPGDPRQAYESKTQQSGGEPDTEDQDEEEDDVSQKNMTTEEYHAALDRMSVAELRSHATQEEVDLGDARSKADILKKIKEAD